MNYTPKQIRVHQHKNRLSGDVPTNQLCREISIAFKNWQAKQELKRQRSSTRIAHV